MKLSTKLLLLVAAALLGVVLLAAMSLYTLRDALIDSRRDEIVILLTKAEHLVDSYRAMQANGTLTAEQAQQQAKAALSALNANSKSYFWVTTSDGVNLASEREVHRHPRQGQSHDGRPVGQRRLPRGWRAITSRSSTC
jgi:methyl-accepting chemotaxis protein